MKATLEKEIDPGSLDKVIEKYRGAPGDILGILEEVQELHGHKYLPKQTLEYIAGKTDTPLSRIYSVVTFYAFFNLKPQGEHTVIVCRGTACHTKGSKALLDDLESYLGIRGAFEEGESFCTTPDNKFTVKTVACFGQCALAPVVVIDGNIYVHMTTKKVRKILDKIRRGGKKR